MSVVADQPVRDLVSRHGLGRTLFVEAGAGTGKTSQLVERVVNLVLDEGVRLADIAAITFTEAAAAELQDRIRVRFEQEAAAAGGEVRRRCQEAVADADLAAITTLHGFAKRILSEHGVDVGLPPRVEVVDEVSSLLAQEARWERFVDALHQDPQHEELLVRAHLLEVPVEPRYERQATLKDVAVTLAQSWDRLDAVVDRPVGPLRPLDLSPFHQAVATLEDLHRSCTDPDDKLYVNLQRGPLPALRRLADLDDPRRVLRALRAAGRSGGWSAGRGGRDAAWPCGKDAVRAAVAGVNAAAGQIVSAVSADVLDRLLVLVAREVLAAADARRREGRLEFHDLLVLARRLLRTSPAARRALHQRYQRLLLDEFQDTDPIQIELAVLIAAATHGREPSAWDAVPVEDGRLFFVGDPKQSIYRFRRADIGLFLRARDRFAPDGSCQRLTTNFRTVPPVVTWVNELFARTMPEELAGAQPRYEPLVPHRAPAPGVDHRPVLLGGPVPEGERCKADELRQREAADVARAIDAIRRDPAAWPVGEDGGWRPARLADVTVLVPTRTSLPHLRDALRERGIPYRLDTGTLVYGTQEVRDALAALRAVDDPGDQLSLVAALRSPLYACSDADLFTWSRAGGRWEVTAPTPDAIGPDHPVAAAVAHLRALWEQRWWHGPSDLLDRLLRERRADLLAFGHERPAEVWRRLRFLVDQARAFEEAGGTGLRGFLEWAELQGSEGSRVHEPLLPETDDDAVRVLTVHGSKGLEFPITVLSGMTTLSRSNRGGGISLLWDDDGLPQVRVAAGVATERHDPRADIEAEMDVHEKLRLLYVACTRARDHLLVSCHHNPGDDSYAGRVWRDSQHRPDTWRTLPDLPPAAPPAVQGRLVAPPEDDGERWRAEREALLAPQRRPRTVSATTIAAEAAQPPAADRSHAPAAEAPAADRAQPAAADAAPAPAPRGQRPPGDGDEAALAPLAEEQDERGPVIRRRGRAGTAVGRAVHATLQVIDLADPGDVEAQARRQAELEAVPEAAATVAAMVRSALRAPAVQAAVAARHHKEVYVAAPLGGRTLEGYVDLLVERPDGLVVVDYKTDGVRSEAEVDAKLAAYELQGAAYALALEAATGLAVVECRFVFCRPAGAIERPVADLAAAKDRVRRHLGA